jgi:hypothetical protein
MRSGNGSHSQRGHIRHVLVCVPENPLKGRPQPTGPNGLILIITQNQHPFPTGTHQARSK